MQCELCKQKDAEVHLKHAFNGEVREVHLCTECAAKKGFVAKLSPASLTDFLFGIEAQRKAEPVPPETSCPNCHMRQSDFAKTSRFGCGNCYHVFAGSLIPLIDDLQKGRRHVGKIPARERNGTALTVLKKRLDEAVKLQNFEEAAAIRDEIQSLSSGAAKVMNPHEEATK